MLRHTSKGADSLSQFNRKFKGYYDQLAATGHQLEEAEIRHWYLCGLGPAFEGFSTGIRTSGRALAVPS